MYRAMKFKCRQKGYTLLEILTVILILTALIAAMMLSATELLASAGANNILNNLMTIKTAVYAYYREHTDEIHSKWAAKGTSYCIQSENLHDKLGIGKNYLDSPKITLNDGSHSDYSITDGGYGVHDVQYSRKKDNKLVRETWYVGYKFADNEAEVKAKLKAKAKSAGLHFTERRPDELNGDGIVWMKVFGEWEPPEEYISSQ